MKIFVAGTDTNVGKTLAASWLCLHTGYSYFKPIQTGSVEETDSQVVAKLTGSKIYPEIYSFKEPVSPHLAAKLQNENIDMAKIKLPEEDDLIIEGAGGLFAPINKKEFMIDLIKFLQVPVILVASSRLGTINHTLLSLEALRLRNITILGAIVTGELNPENCRAIEFYGKTKVLAQIPFLREINREVLLNVILAWKPGSSY